MFVRELKINFGKKLKTTAAAFVALAAFGSVGYAQSVNDDLAPTKTEKSSRSKTAPAKSKTVVKNTAKTGGKTVRNSNQSRQSVRKTAISQPSSVKVERSYGSETPDQILNRFMSFQQSAGVSNGDWRRVMAQTEKTLQDNPNNTIAKAQFLIAQGQIAYNERKYAIATNHFKSVLQILPQSSLPHYSLGQTYLANGQLKAAERSFKKAIEQNENFALAYKAMGDVFTAQGEKKKATKYFKKATEISVKEGNLPL